MKIRGTKQANAIAKERWPDHPFRCQIRRRRCEVWALKQAVKAITSAVTNGGTTLDVRSTYHWVWGERVAWGDTWAAAFSMADRTVPHWIANRVLDAITPDEPLVLRWGPITSGGIGIITGVPVTMSSFTRASRKKR